MCCPLVFEFSVGIGGFVIGLGQISFFFSLYKNTFLNSILNVCTKRQREVLESLTQPEVGGFPVVHLYLLKSLVHESLSSSLLKDKQV